MIPWSVFDNATTSRTARSRSIGEYLLFVFITLSSQEIESPTNPGLFSSLILCICVWKFVSTLVFLNTSVSTEGRVVELVKFSTGGKKIRTGGVTNIVTNYRPVFVYRDKYGNQHRVVSSSGSSSPEFKVGDHVPVIFEPDTPSAARINTFWDIWSGAITYGIVGATLLAVGNLAWRVKHM